MPFNHKAPKYHDERCLILEDDPIDRSTKTSMSFRSPGNFHIRSPYSPLYHKKTNTLHLLDGKNYNYVSVYKPVASSLRAMMPLEILKSYLPRKLLEERNFNLNKSFIAFMMRPNFAIKERLQSSMF